ncbi:MAG: RlpA-like double-psi beta-barrel domain-containing protein [Candidatus Falkowbacteria bacterium]
MKKSIYKIIAISLFVSIFSLQTVRAADSSPVQSKLPVQATVLEAVVTPPWDYEALTPMYQISLDPGQLNKGKTFSADIYYSKTNNNYKKVFYFDSKKNVWQPLPTKDDPKNKKVSVEIPFSDVRLAVFASSNILTVGRASWYTHKNGLFAASPDFAKGSVLRVYNLANGKFVDVTINDYGPERNTHPDRVVDLDKVAFKKIAALGAGTINVKIEIIKSVSPNLNQALSPATEPVISASAAVIMSETSGKILWNKNGEQVSPLASLTKIIAAQVFLDTKPTLSRVVVYKKQDEDYNYKYCKPGESAKLKVKDGETMTLSDLLYAALVGSANNAVESLVRNSGLTRDEFISRMNDKVVSWGATSTSFIEPTGLSEKNVSSPHDYAIIARGAYANPIIKKISTTSSYSFSTVNTKVKHTIKNTDKLIAANKFNIIGSKTGYLNEAGYCLMTRIKTNNGNLIVVNFNSSSKANNFLDNEKLISYGMKILKK